MNILYLPVGLPRSGKSSWAKSMGCPIVAPDSIRWAIHGQPHLPEQEGRVWSTAKIMVKALYHAGHTRVVLDATNLRKSYREVWQSPDWQIELVNFLHVPKEECIRRALANNQLYLVEVIERMAVNIDNPFVEA